MGADRGYARPSRFLSPSKSIFFGALLFTAGVCREASAASVMERAWAEFNRELLIESFGVFWIAAEVAILFSMGVAARVFAERPVPRNLSLSPAEVRRAWRAVFLVAALAVFVYGRHLIIAPMPVALERIGESGEDIVARARGAYLARAHTHIALWCTLVVAWMALEIAIVAQGIRAFRRLRGLIRETPRAA